MNESIELHDSKLVAVTCADGEAVVSLSPAYIHRSAGVPGVDPGTGGWCPATFTISSASLSAPLPALPENISDGFLRIASERHDNSAPTEGIFDGDIELSLVLCNGETLTILGRRIMIQLHGEPFFVENFRQ